MLRINEYRRVESLEEAYGLNQKKNNKIIAGGVWLKIGDRRLGTGIDLSGLSLDYITETDDVFMIGAMAVLRDIETHPGLLAYTDGAVKESIRHIVGVQFRNCATIGGSIYGRFGFSDVLTLFLAMDAEVELYEGGMVPLKEFVHMPYDNDILVALHVKKKPIHIVYKSQRNTATDFPVAACAVSEYDGKLHVSVGARPARAELLEIASDAMPGMEDGIRAFAEELAGQFVFGSNRRAGAEYRRHVTGVLLARALRELAGQKQHERRNGEMK